MTMEVCAMLEQCKAEYKSMLTRIEAVIKDKWPETLRGDGAVWQWLDDHRPELREKLRQITKQLNEAWLNGILDEMKKQTLEWGRLQLDIFKGYAQHLKEQAA
ncbi:MAG: hypothetical protein C5B59_01420 [Bacteroidetes bacterium]|nr:MAG: hypothetical protein C5B59_01420 [Bacteroidota bacterium]